MHRPYRPRDICGPSARHCICEHYVLYKELKICVTLTNALNTSHRRRNGICVTVIQNSVQQLKKKIHLD